MLSLPLVIFVRVILSNDLETYGRSGLPQSHLTGLANHHTTVDPPEVKVLLTITSTIKLKDLDSTHLAFASLDASIRYMRLFRAVRTMGRQATREALLLAAMIKVCAALNTDSHANTSKWAMLKWYLASLPLRREIHM
jgi:hypothetical protein